MEAGTQVGLTEDQVKSILDIRRERSAIFGEGLFSDPAWDILLELLAARLGRRKTTLSSLNRIAPKSVIGRWVALLEERGLIACDCNPLRPHQFCIRLNDECADRVIRFLSAARHFQRPE